METDINRLQFHDTFFEESFEGIEEMETELLNLSPGSANKEIINKIFRAAHSIKGNAGTFGFSEISDFTHKIETVLARVRNDEIKITQQLISVLLSAVDSLNNMLICNKQEMPLDTTIIENSSIQIESLSCHTMTGKASHKKEAHPQEKQSNDSAELLDQQWRISFFPDKKLFFSGNDPLRLIRELKSLGNVSTRAEVNDVPDFDDLDVHQCYLGWQIDIRGQVTRAQLVEVFSWVKDDCRLEISRKIERRSSKDRRQPPDHSGRRKTDTENRSLRVSTDKIDNLLKLAEELAVTQKTLSHILNDQGVNSSAEISEYLGQLERKTRDLHEQVMGIKMMPVNNAFQRIPRLVHDLSISQGKQVALKITGESTELDKTVLEKIIDPLVHIVRNAVDHGIESPDIRISNGKPAQGTIRIDASLESDYAILRISDDGNGIIPDKLLAMAIEKDIVNKDKELTGPQIQNLIFLPGFSTIDKISDVSGRGVGLDVVRQNITDLGGTVDIWTEQGIGTTFTLRLPLTLKTSDSQIANISKQAFAMPPHSERETVIHDNECLNTFPGEQPLAQTMTLDSAVVINDAGYLYERLGKTSNQDIRIDASAVEKIDTAIMQLLYAFVSKVNALNHKISWINPSNEFKSSAALLGLSEGMKIS